MNVKSFLDTNIFVYCFDRSQEEKSAKAENLIYEALASRQGVVSYQVAQEFVAAVRRFRVPLSFEDIEEYWQTTLLPLLAVYFTPELYARALNIANRDRLSWYDALIVSAALQGGCEVLYSEDLQHGRRFGDLVIENPFF
ncbi:MAG: PIN domain-containing protein [Terriglobales bacterium]|jgi:predicted nucleic acid-binding protein